VEAHRHRLYQGKLTRKNKCNQKYERQREAKQSVFYESIKMHRMERKLFVEKPWIMHKLKPKIK
jgi:hypothetical protein